MSCFAHFLSCSETGSGNLARFGNLTISKDSIVRIAVLKEIYLRRGTGSMRLDDPRS